MWRRTSPFRARCSLGFRTTQPKRSYGSSKEVGHHEHEHGHHEHGHGDTHGHGHQDLRGFTYQPPNYNSPNAKDELRILFLKPALLVAGVVIADQVMGMGCESEKEHPFFCFMVSLKKNWATAEDTVLDFFTEGTPAQREFSHFLPMLQQEALEGKKLKAFLQKSKYQTKYYKYKNPSVLWQEHNHLGTGSWRVEAERARGDSYVHWPSVVVPRA